MASDVFGQVLCADALEIVALQSTSRYSLTAATRVEGQTDLNPVIRILADPHWQLKLEAKPVDMLLTVAVF